MIREDPHADLWARAWSNLEGVTIVALEAYPLPQRVTLLRLLGVTTPDAPTRVEVERAYSQLRSCMPALAHTCLAVGDIVGNDPGVASLLASALSLGVTTSLEELVAAVQRAKTFLAHADRERASNAPKRAVESLRNGTLGFGARPRMTGRPS